LPPQYWAKWLPSVLLYWEDSWLLVDVLYPQSCPPSEAGWLSLSSAGPDSCSSWRGWLVDEL
jgi:hypothetical protein